MYAMAYGHLPFESDIKVDRNPSEPIKWTPQNVNQLYQYIRDHPIKLPRAHSDGLDSDGQELLKRLLVADPRRRITMNDIWIHPFFVKNVI